MKKTISILLLTSVFAGCSTGNNADKKAELDALLKEQSTLNDKIKSIKEQIALSDTTGGDNHTNLVKITSVVPQVFNHYIEVQARVDGDEDLNVSPETMGNVTAVLVKAGDHVSKGQVLAQLDDKIMKQSIGEVQSQLDLVSNLYTKQKSLWDQKIGSEVQFLQAKTNKESLEKRMAAMQEQLDMTRIKSPINGTVDAVNIKVGQSVAPGMPALHVVNLGSLKVKGEVAESFISKVKRGNKVLLYFPDLNQEVKAQVDYSGNSISTLNRTFNVEVRLNSRDGVFHPNMICILKIVDYTSPHAIVVPVKTIQGGTDGNYVLVMITENGKMICKRKPVKPGVSYNGFTEILEGLNEGDQLITLGYDGLVEGEVVKL